MQGRGSYAEFHRKFYIHFPAHHSDECIMMDGVGDAEHDFPLDRGGHNGRFTLIPGNRTTDLDRVMKDPIIHSARE